MLSYFLDVSPASYWTNCPAGPFTKSFPYQASEYGYFEAGAGYYTVRDEKDAALLIYTVSGMGEIEWKGRKSTLEPGSAVLIECHDLHEYRTRSDGEPWVFYWLHVSGAGLEGCRNALLDQLTIVYPRDTDAFLDCFGQLRSIDPLSGPLACAEMSHCVSALCLHMMRARYALSGELAFGRAEIQRVVRHIDACYSRELDLDALSAIAGLSKFYFVRVFTQQTGITPHQYLRQRRVEAARKLLQTTNLPIGEIVEQIGYSDISAFISYFRQTLGMTPLQYRKESFNWM